jgi:tetratricopeptide (TPR) repeat protein
MLHRFSKPGRIAAAFLTIVLGAVSAAWAAPADELKEAQKLYGQGKLAQAMERVDAFLKQQPKDPQGRFLRGLVLTEQKKVPEAIQAFTALTEDFPELPEPYNNLAVLYASQGNYEKARSALELAIHTHPSYATAHENLGDIYAQLASRAYDRALQLDKNNTSAQVKLAMVKDLFSSQRVASAAKAAPAAAPADTAPAKTPEPAKPEPPKAEPKSAVPAPAVVAKAAPPPQPPPPAPAKAAPALAPAPAANGAGDAKTQAIATIEAWAKAWSAKDPKGYLAYYAPDFEVPGGESRMAWEQQRVDRIQKPKSIEVGITVVSARVSGNEATVTFKQSYKSDTLKSSNTKTIKLVKSGERWLIKQERVGG